MVEYLWSHEPFISDEPIELLKHNMNKNGDQIDESAVFKLKNDKYLYIRFYGTTKDLKCGITDIEEFDKQEEALMLYEQFI